MINSLLLYSIMEPYNSLILGRLDKSLYLHTKDERVTVMLSALAPYVCNDANSIISAYINNQLEDLENFIYDCVNTYNRNNIVIVDIKKSATISINFSVGHDVNRTKMTILRGPTIVMLDPHLRYHKCLPNAPEMPLININNMSTIEIYSMVSNTDSMLADRIGYIELATLINKLTAAIKKYMVDNNIS